ncbi:MAG: hypothetical protein EBQ96_04610 [Proteobacteria bacterium]|nr:hypothetical protein [Pseudomonadota bacterium]
MTDLDISRLKIAHVAAIIGDICLVLTGMAGMNNWVASAGIGDLTFIIGGLAALVGHTALMFKAQDVPAGLRLTAFIVSGLCYAVSGVGLDNYAFVLAGLLISGAALLGWLVPRGTKIAGSSKPQAISGILVISTLLTYTAAVQCDNPMLFIAAIFFTACNVADYFARKNTAHGG